MAHEPVSLLFEERVPFQVLSPWASFLEIAGPDGPILPQRPALTDYFLL